jgi:thiamine-monophosphate kinase
VTGEFKAIDRLTRLLPSPEPGAVGIGDDAAAVRPPGGWLLLAADAVVAGVHADLTLSSLDDLGWKSMAVNVSDIAAMGGRPLHALVTVAGPPDTDLDLLYRGVAEAARAYDCPVVGGDLANARVLVVSVAMTGTVEGDPVQRRGAAVGDGIYLTGPVGLSAAGLRQLRSGVTDTAAVSAHRRPFPVVAAGVAAKAGGATAMIDVSDGLCADLGHLADASGVGVALDSVPVGEGATIDEALTGGEDYVLVFTAPDDALVSGAFSGVGPVTRIGFCTADPAERTLGGHPFPPGGFEHEWMASGDRLTPPGDRA